MLNTAFITPTYVGVWPTTDVDILMRPLPVQWALFLSRVAPVEEEEAQPETGSAIADADRNIDMFAHIDRS